MYLSDYIQIVSAMVVSWLVIVFFMFHILSHFIKPVSSRTLVRVLYIMYGVVLYILAYFVSPFRRAIEIGRTGFWVSIAVFLLFVLVVIFSGIGGSSKKEDE